MYSRTPITEKYTQLSNFSFSSEYLNIKVAWLSTEGKGFSSPAHKKSAFISSFKISLPSDSLHRLRFNPSTADTDLLLGSLAFFEGETISWLNRFLLTFVTSVDNQNTGLYLGLSCKHGNAY